MSDNKRERPILISVVASKGVFADVLAATDSFLGDPEASAEKNREEVERLAQFLEEVAQKFREDSIQEFGDDSKDS